MFSLNIGRLLKRCSIFPFYLILKDELDEIVDLLDGITFVRK